jgi:hypothetical protein
MIEIFGEKVDRIVVESEEDGVRVCGVFVGVYDCGCCDSEEESLKYNGVSMISGIVVEKRFDGVEVSRRNGEWVLIGYCKSEGKEVDEIRGIGKVEVICRLVDMDGWSDIKFERIGFVGSGESWLYEVDEREDVEESGEKFVMER